MTQKRIKNEDGQKEALGLETPDLEEAQALEEEVSDMEDMPDMGDDGCLNFLKERGIDVTEMMDMIHGEKKNQLDPHNPADAIKVHLLHCGEVNVDPALPFRDRSKNPLAFTGLFRSRKERIWLPVSAYLIEHPKGRVLVDTGWHSDVRQHQLRHLGPVLRMVNAARLAPGAAVDEQLAAMGLKPSDIDYLLLSHLDCDHVSGLRLMRDAHHIMVSQKEWKVANRPSLRYRRAMWRGVNVQPFEFNHYYTGTASHDALGQSYDLFDDGSVVLISTPGHSRGHTAVKVQRGDNYILLAGDCGYAAQSWQQIMLPSLCNDRHDMRRSLRWMRKEAASPHCLAALANHDPAFAPCIFSL